jgi:5-methylcytosine-specific restriction endonuclease McrA
MDEQDSECAYCGCDISEDFHVDHIIPLAKGGTNEPDNICLSCPTCNLQKSDRLDFEKD